MSDCTTVDLPATEADFCSPDINYGGLQKIYLGNPGNPFTDWADPAEWTARLDNADVADPTKIRTLHIIGDKPAPERPLIEFSLGREIYGDAEHTINVKVDETGPTNYALVQWLEDNAGQRIQIWWEHGKYLSGGNDGVSAILVLDPITPESDEELEYFGGTVKFEGKNPARIENPIAA